LCVRSSIILVARSFVKGYATLFAVFRDRYRESKARNHHVDDSQKRPERKARTKQKAFLDSSRYRRPHPTALRTTRLALGLTIKGKKFPFQHADNEMMLYLCIASAELYHLAICHLGVACFQITVAGPHAILHQSLFTGKTSSVRYRIQLNSHQIQEAVCMTARLSRYAPHMLMYHC
jgi:hypothetical protein